MVGHPFLVIALTIKEDVLPFYYLNLFTQNIVRHLVPARASRPDARARHVPARASRPDARASGLSYTSDSPFNNPNLLPLIFALLFLHKNLDELLNLLNKQLHLSYSFSRFLRYCQIHAQLLYVQYISY